MLALIETKLFQFITFFVVHLRASVDGITNVCRDIYQALLNPNHRRMLVPTWMAWRSIQILERSGYDEALHDIRFAFSHHAHNAISGSGLRCKVYSDDDIWICMQANISATQATQSEFRHEHVQFLGKGKFRSFLVSTHALVTVAFMVLQCRSASVLLTLNWPLLANDTHGPQDHHVTPQHSSIETS